MFTGKGSSITALCRFLIEGQHVKRPRYIATSGRFISHRWVEIRIDQRPHSGNALQTVTSIFVTVPMVPRGIERLDGELLVLMCCDATDVRLEWVLVE